MRLNFASASPIIRSEICSVQKQRESCRVNLFAETRICRYNYFILGKRTCVLAEKWNSIVCTSESFTDSVNKISISVCFSHSAKLVNQSCKGYLCWQTFFFPYENRRGTQSVEDARGVKCKFTGTAVHRFLRFSAASPFLASFEPHLTGN